jgi:hypothetical protein
MEIFECESYTFSRPNQKHFAKNVTTYRPYSINADIFTDTPYIGITLVLYMNLWLEFDNWIL